MFLEYILDDLPVGALGRLGLICCCFIFLFDSIFGTFVFSFFFSGFSDFGFSTVLPDVLLVPDVDVEDNTSGLKSILVRWVASELSHLGFVSVFLRPGSSSFMGDGVFDLVARE